MTEDYQTLELKAEASLDEIKSAYHKLIAVWNPENFGYSPRLQAEAQERLVRINQAYERLCKLKASENVPNEQSVAKRDEAKPLDKNLFPTRPVNKWVGERFIFLPQSKNFQEYGYLYAYKDEKKWGGHLPHDEYAGRIARVTKVAPSKVHPREWDVDFVLEDNGERVYANTLSGEVKNMALIADIENARRQYAGKTLWTEEAVKTYNEVTGDDSLLCARMSYFPVKVLDVVPGCFNNQPVRFTVQIPSGEKGFIDVYMSATNISTPLEFHSFEKVFFTEYPMK